MTIALVAVLALPAAAAAHTATGTARCDGAQLQFRDFAPGENTVSYKLTVDGVQQRRETFTFRGTSGEVVVGFQLPDARVHRVVVSTWWDTRGQRAGSEADPAFTTGRDLSCHQSPVGPSAPGQPGGQPSAPSNPAQPPAPQPAPVPVAGQGPAGPCPACPPTASGQGNVTVCKRCVSRRLLTIRLIERRGHRLRSATVRMRGRTFRVHRRRSDGRMVARLDFRGLRGPDVMAARISAVEMDGDRVRATRLFRICRPKDGITVNFDELRL